MTITHTITCDWGASDEPLYFTVRDHDDNDLVARTNTGVREVLRGGVKTKMYAAKVATWNPAWGGYVLWDNGDGASFAIEPFDPMTVPKDGGVRLADDGLDGVSTAEPAGAVGTWNFRHFLLMLFRRFYGKVTMTSSQLKVYKADGTTVASTQSLNDDNTTQTQGGST